MVEGAPVAPAPAKFSLKSVLSGLSQELGSGLGNVFQNVKDRAFEEIGKSPLAQEAKEAEIRRMMPMIAVGVVAVLVAGYFIGRKGV